MNFRLGDSVYIDESKARGYYVVATAAATRSVRDADVRLRELLKPGQRRIHFKSEHDSRRRQILSVMCELADVRASVWVVKGRPDRVARPMCLEALTLAASSAGVSQMFIERDDSLAQADRRLIASVLRKSGGSDLCYQHVAPHERPLLWISDAVAWCCSNGGDWSRRAQPLIEGRMIRL